MTPQEQNIAVAEKLGWDHRKWRFDLDANTRPQMLASLTEGQKYELITTHTKHVFTTKACLLILELTQPQFCELFLKVTGGWKE